jgi:biotin carboxyl carrier protein
MKSYKIRVNGKSYDVSVEELGAAEPQGAKQPQPPTLRGPARAPAPVPPQAAAVQVKASMPGTVLGYRVQVGHAVKAGDVLLILEAMKMENEIVAPSDGVVTALDAAEGASVSTGQVLVTIG